MRCLGHVCASSGVASAGSLGRCIGLAVVVLAALCRVAWAVDPVPADDAISRLSELARQLERDHAAPRAFVLLVQLSELEGDLPDLARAARLYRRLADDGKAHPEVRAYARFRLACLERARGNGARSKIEFARLGFLSRWQVAGSFENEGKQGFDRVFPPERSQDLTDRFPGKVREVRWRPLPPEAVSMGFANLGASLRPAKNVVAYALSVVDSSRDEPVQLHLGASGAVKVFVNGVLVHADPSYHVARLDQSAVRFRLRKGANRILVKLCQAEGRFGFFARLSDARGAPIVRRARTVPPLPPAVLPAPGKGGPLPGVLAALEQAARKARGREGARAHRDLAIALAERRPGEDREERAAGEARRAAELDPRSVEARLLAARLERDDNRSRDQLEAAIEVGPRDAGALAALARHELDRGHLVRAAGLLDRALAARPGCIAARLALADLHEQAGFGARARTERAALARAHPAHPAAVMAGARAARGQERLEEAGALLRKALALRFDDFAARAALTQVLLDRGDLDGAVHLIEEAILLDPGDLSARLRLADLLAANGRGEEAEVAFANALAIAPEEAETLERRGQARLRAGRTQDALADFQVALELRPQNPRLKELMRAIEPARERFETPYEYDAAKLARAEPAGEADEDAIVLGDLKVTKVYPSGLSSTFRQMVVRVLTTRGADAWRTFSTGYTPGRQELRIERARVVRPDGSAVDTHQERDRSGSEPWYRLYYDTRVRTLAFPALAAGDLLEIAVRIDDVASENLLSDYFGDLTYFGDTFRKARADYVLLVPDGRRIFEHAAALPGLARSERALPGGLVERRFTVRDVPRVRPEPGMPGSSEVVPFVHVSTYERWDDVGRFFWGLVREQLSLSPEVREAALRIASAVKAGRRARREPEAGDELALVQAVHRFVVTNIRYVGLEFGIHGYKPYRVGEILDRRFGDCKDKASLAHALLEALGIDSRLALVRTQRLGRIPTKPASLSVFNHAILYVPRYDLWLDGTASYSGSRDLPGEDRGATALVVNPDGSARIGTIPEGRPEENLSESWYEIRLGLDGSAHVKGEARVTGARAPDYRRAYAAENDRRAQLEMAMSRIFPGLTVKEIAVSDLARLEDDVTLRFSLSLARLADREKDGLRFLPFGSGHRFVEALAPLSARRFDLVIGEPSETRFVYRYLLPPGFTPLEMPSPVEVDGPSAALQASCRLEGGAVVAEARIRVKKGRVSAADYPGFRDFLAQVDRALMRPIRVGPLRAGAEVTGR